MDGIVFVTEDVRELTDKLYQAYNALEKFYEMYEGLYYGDRLDTECDAVFMQLVDVQSDILDATTAIEACTGLLD